MRRKPRFFKKLELEDVTDEPISRRQLKWAVHYFLYRRLICELIRVHSAHFSLEGIRFLKAHGKKRAPEYLYFDSRNKQTKRVQNWIDRYDGKYAVLIIGACNHQHYSITSRRSIVVHASKSWSPLELMRVRGALTRVYVPGKGYVEEDYRLLKCILATLSKKEA